MLMAPRLLCCEGSLVFCRGILIMCSKCESLGCLLLLYYYIII